MDFATDERPAKRVAREMLRMVASVNAALAGLPEREAPREKASCATCHRGASRPPLPLEEELVRAVEGGGAPAAAARFAELRATHLIDGRYDFRPHVVVRAARRLLDAKRLDEGLAVARLNLEHDAGVADTHFGIGEALLARGDREAARDSYRKALGIDPGNAQAVFRLKQLEEPAR
jgi:tetratricopeptide (TPR) repeat protein